MQYLERGHISSSDEKLTAAFASNLKYNRYEDEYQIRSYVPSFGH
jgi:hypothetical protein